MTAGLRRALLAAFITIGIGPAVQAMAIKNSVNGPANGGGLGSAAYDSGTGFAYFASTEAFIVGSSSFSYVFQQPIPTFPTGGSSYALQGIQTPTVVLTDTAGNAYFADASSPTVISKVNSALSIYSSATIPSGQHPIGTGVIDNTTTYMYLGSYTMPGQILKVDTTNLVVVSSITLGTGEGLLASSVIDTVGGFAYFGSSTTPGIVSKIRLSDLTEINPPLTFKSNEGAALSALIDVPNLAAYFGTGDRPGKVVKVALSNFTEVTAVPMNSGEDSLTSAVIDPVRNYGYFGTDTDPGKIVQVALSGMSRSDVLPLTTGQSRLHSAVIDGDDFGYFGTFVYPTSQIVMVDLVPDPPAILVPVANQSVSEGAAVTFTVQADGRGLTYQWYRIDRPGASGVLIPGATAAAYTFTPSLADNGSSYFSLVTNSLGHTTQSNAGTLTVIPVVEVFPNPWRADRGWPVIINFTRMAPNSTVKIFTLSAHWVKTLSAAGGSTTWDLTNDAGQNVASGYYFYLITTPDDNQTVHGKLAIIR